MDIKAYWKAYHAKNRDKINESRRYRYKMSKPTKFEGVVFGVDDHPIRYEQKLVETPMPKGVLCSRPLCDSYETDPYPINGRRLYLCVKHQPKT